MTEIDPSITLTYRAIDYSFCSLQCRDRFDNHPHLYVGDPQHGLSEKQKGKTEIKVRKIVLKNALNEVSKTRVSKKITALMGVVEVDVGSTDLRVKYDLLQVSLEDIENAIVEVLGEIKASITEKIKRSYIHYSEECELDNLSHLTKGGCH